MNKILTAGLGLGLLTLVPQTSKAGVSVDLRFGFPEGHGHHRGFVCAPPPICGPRVIFSDCRPRHHGWRRTVVIEPDPVVIVREPRYVETSYVRPAPEIIPEAPSSFQLGHDWAKDLRDDVASREQFVSYLRMNLCKSSTGEYSEFRRGFIATYGVNGEAAFDKAYQEARADR